ncbi:MAG: hypothetical protein F6K19_29955 [Cyanothece sp. SIO1E1]|nr:hypothetical protein [Cyanothece sp. SIO1E1]
MPEVTRSKYKYCVGGAVPLDHGTYVKRQADDVLYQGLTSGDFCYVLSSPQMGKSSLLLRAMQTLEDMGRVCVNINLAEDLGIDVDDLSRWYDKLLALIAQGLQLDISNWGSDYQSRSPQMRLMRFVEDVLLANTNRDIVIFLDEIDSVLGLSFSVNEFFRFIRLCYNQRSFKPKYKRLTFALFGAIHPSELAHNLSPSPFDIGKTIQLHHFERSQAEPLTQGLTDKVHRPQIGLEQILDWTGGQPWLTQHICDLVAQSESPIPAGAEANAIKQMVTQQVIENWQTQEQALPFREIRDRLLAHEPNKAKLLELYQRTLQNGEVVAVDTPVRRALLLSGLVVEQQGKLRVANRIYQAIFNQAWVAQALSEYRSKITLQPAIEPSGSLEIKPDLKPSIAPPISSTERPRALRSYTTKLNTWIASGQKNKLQLLSQLEWPTAINWAEHQQDLTPQERDFLIDSLIWNIPRLEPKVFDQSWRGDEILAKPIDVKALKTWLTSEPQDRSQLMSEYHLQAALYWADNNRLDGTEHEFLIESLVWNTRARTDGA